MLGIGFAPERMPKRSAKFRKRRYIYRNKLAISTAGARKLGGNVAVRFSTAEFGKLGGNVAVRFSTAEFGKLGGNVAACRSGTKRLGGIYDNGHQFQRTYGGL